MFRCFKPLVCFDQLKGSGPPCPRKISHVHGDLIKTSYKATTSTLSAPHWGTAVAEMTPPTPPPLSSGRSPELPKFLLLSLPRSRSESIALHPAPANGASNYLVQFCLPGSFNFAFFKLLRPIHDSGMYSALNGESECDDVAMVPLLSPSHDPTYPPQFSDWA